MAADSLDVAVIGGGPAGLSTSYFLNHYGLHHVVLERGRIGESWLTQRWNSFVLNSPNKYNVLPGDIYRGAHPDGFDTAKDFVAYLRSYARRFHLPVQEQSRVVSVERNSSTYRITALLNNTTQQYTSRQVVVASGALNERRLPSFAMRISPNIQQIHASEYRSPGGLPDGAVLVIGSAQSGLQVAEDIIDSGKKVYLSTSAVARVPRRYRGKDIFEWLIKVGFFDVRTEDITDPREFEQRQPQVSGVGPFGHTQSLQFLARKGAVIIGTIDGASGNIISIQANAADHIKFSDEASRKMKARIEQCISQNHLSVPPSEPDPADEPDTTAESASFLTSLNLEKEHIRSIIWATGFTGNFGYLKGLGVDDKARPSHRNGIANAEGVFFVGIPWLRKRKSGIIHGIVEDAEFIAEHLRSSS